ncbi:MAG: sugar ABC transporter permease [Anaerolineae bacterium]|nr:sugar ABC transporter permease [Anaerolineae bacterium]
MSNLESFLSYRATRSLSAGEYTRLWQRILPYLLVLPTFAFVFTFTLLPTANALIQSLYQPGNARIPTRFVGLQNYLDLFNPNTLIGADFLRIAVNTLIYVATTVPISMTIGFGLALLLNRKIRGLALFRFAFFYPVLIPMIGAGSIFAFLFADQIGLLNTILRSFGLPGIKWIGDPNWTLIAIIMVSIWKQTGFCMIMYLAGLQGLPQDVYEAAELDGANAWQKIRRITLPLLGGTTLFILTTSIAASFQMVDHLYALGEGQPNERSNLLLYFVFQKYNEPRNQGYVSAITVILLAALLIFTVINFWIWERRTYYEN